ncbi:DUF885 family protein [Kangiella sp. HZ709]|uniref:DUF885 domain-containing protein n=1 Tax=Kangiella sp. HZ709 TaxID=2666328 RepID=UPI0012B071B1|nr:DUF885 domain-containing protein [Kangiella sp. HZ709]MRX28607.1 DUF885 family protein [Kangiella sp. HZ709]
MIKKIFKWFFILLFTLIALLGLWVWQAAKKDKPLGFPFMADSIDVFFNRVAISFIEDSPETLSSLRVLEQFGIKGHQDDLDDASIEAGNKGFEKTKKNLEILKSYEDSDLTDGQKLSKELMVYLLQQGVDGEKFRYHNYPVNQLFGAQSNFPSFMDAQHQVNSLRDAEDYVTRLSKVDTKFEQILEGIKLRTSMGVVPPKFVIKRVLDEMNAFVEQPIEENILYASLAKKLEKADIENAEKDEVLAKAKAVIKDDVHRAYNGFISYFSSLDDNATTDDGIWKLPDGGEAYKYALKQFTTTDYSADYIHNTGVSEVQRIQAEILDILSNEGFDVSVGFTSAMKTLSDDPRFYYPDTDEGRQQILDDYQVMIDEISGGLDSAFRVKPKAPVEVKRIPLFKEKTSPGAYYQGPSLDGSRPGIFYANLYDIKATPKYGMRTLAYHEAVPGHHFQIAITQELEDMPIFRNFSLFTAYSEGWALYTERLAWELGFQSNPYDNIGRLQAELFRAVRLVVDTGIHAKRWTREEAIDYMQENTGMAESDVISEIERYIVMPGQATAYKVGMMKILELREKAKAALGNKFDLRDFHDQVLKNGAVPLSVLEKLINRYIETKLQA